MNKLFFASAGLGVAYLAAHGLAARGETPAAFGRRCIPADCVAPPSHIPDMLGRRALSAGRLAALGATLDFHHGLLAEQRLVQKTRERRDAAEHGDQRAVEPGT